MEHRATGHFSSTVGVADTLPPSVGTRIQCLSNPIAFVITTTISPILILTVIVEINLSAVGCSRIVLGRPEAVLAGAIDTNWHSALSTGIGRQHLAHV